MTDIQTHKTPGHQIAELTSHAVLIKTLQDGIDLIGNLAFQGYDAVLMYEYQLTPDFFDLRSGIAGELLQKFSNYRMRLAVVGDFSQNESKSLQAFIAESNRVGAIYFAPTVGEGLQILSTHG